MAPVEVEPHQMHLHAVHPSPRGELSYDTGASARIHFPFFAARRSRLDFGFGPFAGRSDANPPAFGAMPQHLPVVEYFIPLRL